MPEIPFIGGAYTDRSRKLNSQICQNLIPILDQQGGKSVKSLKGIPGAKQYYDLGVGIGNVGRKYTITISGFLGLVGDA